MGFECVQNTLTRGSIRNKLPACQGGSKCAALGRVLAFGAKEKRVLAPDVDAALGAVSFEDLGYFSRWRNRETDDTAADMVHDVGDRAVAVDHVGNAGIFCCVSFHAAVSVCCPLTSTPDLNDLRVDGVAGIKPGSHGVTGYFPANRQASGFIS